MYKLDIRVDTKESAAIERRRNLERQRQSRIFNARERTIGVGLLWLCESFYPSYILSDMLPVFLNIFKCFVSFSVFCCYRNSLCIFFVSVLVQPQPRSVQNALLYADAPFSVAEYLFLRQFISLLVCRLM